MKQEIGRLPSREVGDKNRIKALDMQMAWAYKLRRYWKDCPKCYHLIAPEGYSRICQCERLVVPSE